MCVPLIALSQDKVPKTSASLLTHSWEAREAWSPHEEDMTNGCNNNIHKIDKSMNCNASLQCHFICIFFGHFSISGNISLVLSVLHLRVPVQDHKCKAIPNVLRM